MDKINKMENEISHISEHLRGQELNNSYQEAFLRQENYELKLEVIELKQRLEKIKKIIKQNGKKL